MTEQRIVAGLPQREVRVSKSATVTVTQRDGARVATSTWETCAGVGRFVADLLGQPTAHHTIERTPDAQTVDPQ